jgi:hypothetical protein
MERYEGKKVAVARSSPLRARPKGNIVFGPTFTIGAELPR